MVEKRGRPKNKESYRAIFTADLHSSNRLPYSKPIENGMTDRLQDVINVIEKLLDAARVHEAKSIFILGDIFDRSLVDAVTLTHTTRALAKTPVPLYVMAGNHDANSIRGGRFVVETFGVIDHKRLKYLDKEMSPNGWLKFIPVPFMTIEETEKRIKEKKKKLDGNFINVLLFHNSVLECEHLEWTCDDGLDPYLLTDGFNFALGGHFHAPQKFGVVDNGCYVGAPLQHNFGDRNRLAGFWVVDFYKDCKMKKKFIDGGAPSFYVVNELRKDKIWKKGDYVRVEIECTHSDWINIQSKVKMFCDSLEGIHASYKHKPIYHHKKRLASVEKSDKITLETALNEYISSVDVIIGELDKERLKNIGNEILQEVRTENGII